MPPPVHRTQRDVPAAVVDAVEDAAPLTETAPAEALSKEMPAADAERVQPQTQTAAATVTAQASVQSAAPAQRPQMPDADMQRLMQVGGKILRE